MKTLLAMLCLLVAMAGAADDLVLHLDFDTREGALYRDLSGNGNHGAPRDTPQVPGVQGHGVVVGRNGQCVAVKPPAMLTQPVEALTMEAWIAVDKLQFIVGIIGTGEWYQGKEPFGLWLNYGNLDLHITRPDGTRLEMRARDVIRKITRPHRTYYQVVGTYDGEVGRLYVDGKPVAESKALAKQPVAALKKDILVGRLYGSPWQTLNGALDEVRILSRTLSAEEVAARYAERANWQPAPLVKEFPGTLDGQPYVGTGRYDSFVSCQLPNGTAANFSNVGDFNLDIREWSDTWGFTLLDQRSRKERFWKEVDGTFEFDMISHAFSYELHGVTHHGLRMRQVAGADADGRLMLHYEVESPDGKGPVPFMPMRYNLPTAASKRFVGNTPDGLVCGSLPDLDSTVHFRNVVDWAFVELRVGMRLGEGVEYQMEGSRDPRRWQNGYSGFMGRVYRPDFGKWEAGKKWVADLEVQVRDAQAEPWLDAAAATPVTADKRFDFSPLYEPPADAIAIVPVGRRVPVYGVDESITLRVQFPPAMRPKLLTYRVVVSQTGKVILEDEIKLSPDWWNLQPPVIFDATERGVYLVEVRALDADRTELGTAVQEVAVAGPIPQPVLAPGERPAMDLVDQADLTKDGDHDYFSYSGEAKVVDIGGTRYRQTLTFDKMQALGLRHDWIGCRLRIAHPMRPHVIEIDHPNLDGMNMAINILEPKNEGPEVTQFVPLNRGLSGVWTGAGYPADDAPRTTSIVYFPSASWVAITMQNIHDRFMPDKPGAAVAAVRIYELRGDLPRTLETEPTDRLLGVFTEGGTLGLGAFGEGTYRGQLPKLPPPETFYRQSMVAVENLARYLRYRGDSVYLYGAVRYRTAEYPGRTAPPKTGLEHGDLVALMAKVFEYNGLKLLLGIEANPLINVQRLPGYGTSLNDIVAGADHVRQVGPDGQIPTSGWGATANPFHPTVQAEYANLAAEIGELYRDFPAVAGIAWMTGNGSITCPTLIPNNRWERKEDQQYPIQYSTTYDDTTMAQFAEFLGRELPGAAGDPGRFRERFDWIMTNALDQWTEFRCRSLAAMYKSFKNAMRSQAPGMEMFVMDDNMGVVTAPPLQNAGTIDLLRVFSFDPRYYRGEPGLNYALLMPDPWEWYDRGRMRNNPDEWLEDSLRYENDADLWATLDPVNGGVFLHRQFEEKGVDTPPDRDWVFPRGIRMGTCNYPQPVGRQNLKQFAAIVARSTPKLICWMWCDSGIPIGHEESMREFAAAWRRLPLGEYRTVQTDGPVVVRACPAAQAWYVVNTAAEPRTVQVTAPTKQTVTLKPYEVQAFVGQ